MSEGAGNAAYGRASELSSGPFAGWMTWGQGQDPYETLIGPFCYKAEVDGTVRIAFQPEQKHLNGAGAVHGGCLMSFADFSLFAIAHHSLKAGVMAVTLTCNTEFVGAGGLDGPIQAHGRVIRETGSLIFVQGLLEQRSQPILAFSGTLKKLKDPKA